MRNIQNILNSQELRIFVAFLLIFSIFLHWGGTNSWSRFDLTQAIVHDQSIDISNYSHNTMDKAIMREDVRYSVNSSMQVDVQEFRSLNYSEQVDIRSKRFELAFENKSVPKYTDKAPMSSLVAIPGYLTGYFLGGFFEAQKEVWIDKKVVDKPVNLSIQTALKQFFVVLSVSAFLGALLLVLVYRNLVDYTDKKIALYSTIIAGLATPLFVYSTNFFGVITAAFFGYASYRTLEQGLEKNRKWIYISGILSALAFSTEYYAAIVPAFLLLYLAAKKDIKPVLNFSLGVFLGAIPLFLYHWLLTGHPLIPAMMSLAIPGPVNTSCTIFELCAERSKIIFGGFVAHPSRVLNIMFRLLFFETRGLFFYSPILLLSIPGTYELYKRNKKLLILFPGIFLAFLLFQSVRLNWLAGVSFGPRYMIVGLPFLVLPVALGLEKILSKGKIWRVFVLLVFLISAFNMFLGFNLGHGLELDNETYSERFHSFSPIQPDLYDKRVERFKTYGPRSELMMSLTDRYRGFDITYRQPYGQEFIELWSTDNQGILFSLNMLPIILLTTILALFWPNKGNLRRSMVIGILILTLLSIQTSEVYTLGETYRQNIGEINNAGEELTFVYYLDEGEIPRLNITDLRANSTESIEISVNGNKRNYQLGYKEQLHFFRNISEGRNTVKIRYPDCEVPAIQRNSSDIRCNSFSFINNSLVSIEEIEPFKARGWHPKEENGRWMKEKARVYTGERLLNLSIRPYKGINHPEFTVYVNGREVINQSILKDSRFLLPVQGRKVNEIIFRSKLGCVKPSNYEERAEDDRCLSFFFEKLEIVNQVKRKQFVGDWYAQKEAGRWMSKNAMIAIPRGDFEEISLQLRPYEHLENSRLDININGRQVDSYNGRKTLKDTYKLNNTKNMTLISFKSRSSCRIPSEVEDSQDKRCLSYMLEKLELK